MLVGEPALKVRLELRGPARNVPRTISLLSFLQKLDPALKRGVFCIYPAAFMQRVQRLPGGIRV